jgi:hypothetical protein
MRCIGQYNACSALVSPLFTVTTCKLATIIHNRHPEDLGDPREYAIYPQLAQHLNHLLLSNCHFHIHLNQKNRQLDQEIVS